MKSSQSRKGLVQLSCAKDQPDRCVHWQMPSWHTELLVSWGSHRKFWQVHCSTAIFALSRRRKTVTTHMWAEEVEDKAQTSVKESILSR